MNQVNYLALPGLREHKNIFHNTTAKDVIDKILSMYDMDMVTMKSATRRREVVFVRHLTMYWIRRKTGASLKYIGEIFNRDHTSVIHAIQTIENYIETNSFGKRDEIVNIY